MMSFAAHTARVQALVREEPVRRGDKPDVGGDLQRLCRAATKDLPASGVGVSLLSGSGEVLVVAASSVTSELVEELQFTLGEGPCLDAFATRKPVLVPDLGKVTTTSWAGYAPAAYEHGVRAVFAFPLQIGTARLGALDVYREYAGALTSWSAARALSYADVAMQTMLDAQQNDTALGEAASGDSSFEVYQAQGMVKVQLGVSAAQALVRLRAYAYLHDRRLLDVARDVIARRLVLEPDDTTDDTSG
jgi:hypothetical protein